MSKRKSHLSDEMRRVLKLIRSGRATTPHDCGCNYLTFAALERRGLIRVETTLASIIHPQGARANPAPPPGQGRE